MTQQMPSLGVQLARPQAWLLCLAVLAVLAAPTLVQLSRQATDTRLIDNRAPAPFPPLPDSVAGIAAFRDGLGRFIDDNFGLRFELVRLNLLIRGLIGESGSPMVIVGKHGWTFLKSDYAITDQFRGLDRFSAASLDGWIDTMEAYRAWLEARGIAYVILIAPNQQTIYPDKMPMSVNRVWPETRLDQVVRRLRERGARLVLVDPRAALWAQRSKAQLYQSDDSHWNDLGAFVVYGELMRAVQGIFPAIEPLTLSDFAVHATMRARSILPRREYEPKLDLIRPSKIIASEVLQPIGPRTERLTSTHSEKTPSLLLYGDSYARHRLLDFLGETFRWTIGVTPHTSPFPADLIVEHRPDLVVFELAERFLARPLTDARLLEADRLIETAPQLPQLIARSEGVGGYVDSVVLDVNAMRLTGWAVDAAAMAPAQRIYAYQGERVIGAALPYLPRPDVLRGHNAGFDLHVRAARRAITDTGQLRMFSINSGERVREVAVTPEARARIDLLLREPTRPLP